MQGKPLWQVAGNGRRRRGRGSQPSLVQADPTDWVVKARGRIRRPGGAPVGRGAQAAPEGVWQRPVRGRDTVPIDRTAIAPRHRRRPALSERQRYALLAGESALEASRLRWRRCRRGRAAIFVPADRARRAIAAVARGCRPRRGPCGAISPASHANPSAQGSAAEHRAPAAHHARHCAQLCRGSRRRRRPSPQGGAWRGRADNVGDVSGARSAGGASIQATTGAAPASVNSKARRTRRGLPRAPASGEATRGDWSVRACPRSRPTVASWRGTTALCSALRSRRDRPPLTARATWPWRGAQRGVPEGLEHRIRPGGVGAAARPVDVARHEMAAPPHERAGTPRAPRAPTRRACRCR